MTDNGLKGRIADISNSMNKGFNMHEEINKMCDKLTKEITFEEYKPFVDFLSGCVLREDFKYDEDIFHLARSIQNARILRPDKVDVSFLRKLDEYFDIVDECLKKIEKSCFPFVSQTICEKIVKQMISLEMFEDSINVLMSGIEMKEEDFKIVCEHLGNSLLNAHVGPIQDQTEEEKYKKLCADLKYIVDNIDKVYNNTIVDIRKR